MDRGTDVRAALDLLMKLEPQAAAAGGRVHALMGNHEAMNLLGETRDATPEIFATFADVDSETPARIARSPTRSGSTREELDKTAWMSGPPAGLPRVSRRASPERHATASGCAPSRSLVEINGTIFMHGGLNPETPGLARRRHRARPAGDRGVGRRRQVARAEEARPALFDARGGRGAADAVVRPLAPRIKQGPGVRGGRADGARAAADPPDRQVEPARVRTDRSGSAATPTGATTKARR